MTDYKRSIVVEIDGTGAVVGARKVQASLNDIERATRNVDGGMRRIGDASRSSTSSMYGLGKAAKAAMAYFSVSTMANFARSVLDAGVAMDSLQRSFVAISGSLGAAGQELAFLRQEADRLGQNFYTLAPAFKNISAAATGTALEGQGAKDVFSAITEASTALGMSIADTEGALRALAQMMSKGTVQAEELRGQLGERLPGAFQIMARALGKTTPELNKMLEQGEVLSDVALPALAKEITRMYGAAAQTAALESGQAAINKMSEAWTDFKTNLYDSDQAVQGINAITNAIKTLTEYAGLRSISETFAEGAKMAQEGKLNWEDFKKASYMDRQRMVDNGGALNMFRGKVDKSAIMPAYKAPPAASATIGSKSDASAAAALQKMQEEIAKLSMSAADFEHYQIDQEFAKIAKEIGAANPLLAQWVALRREEAETIRAKSVNDELEDYFGDIDKQYAELLQKAEEDKKRNEEILLDFSDRYRAIVVGETEFKKEQIDRQAEIFRKDGANEIAVAKWVAQEKLAVSRDWQDGATRALQAYTDSATNAAALAEQAFTNGFQSMEDALVEFVATGKMDFSNFADSVISDLARIAIQQSITGPLASGIGSMIGGLFGGSSPSVASVGAPKVGYAKGGIPGAPSLSAYANSIVSSPTIFPFAKGVGLMGEAGPEAIMPLKRGADGSLGVRASAGAVNIVVNNHAPNTKATATSRDDGRGGKSIEVVIDEIGGKNLARHGSASDRALRSRYNLSPALTGR